MTTTTAESAAVITSTIIDRLARVFTETKRPVIAGRCPDGVTPYGNEKSRSAIAAAFVLFQPADYRPPGSGRYGPMPIG